MNRRNDDDRWVEVDALFARVLEEPPPQRAQCLADLRDIDGRLRRAVEQLLRTHDAAQSFLEDPPTLPPDCIEELASKLRGAGATDPPAASFSAAAEPGDRIGAWRIIEELGRGGMATVYLVERADGLYEQTAALKLLRRGLDTVDVLRRFRAERPNRSHGSAPRRRRARARRCRQWSASSLRPSESARAAAVFMH